MYECVFMLSNESKRQLTRYIFEWTIAIIVRHFSLSSYSFTLARVKVLWSSGKYFGRCTCFLCFFRIFFLNCRNIVHLWLNNTEAICRRWSCLYSLTWNFSEYQITICYALCIKINDGISPCLLSILILFFVSIISFSHTRRPLWFCDRNRITMFIFFFNAQSGFLCDFDFG